MKLKSKLCSSLAKIMPAETPHGNYRRGCALQGEIFSLQMAYCAVDFNRLPIKINISSQLNPYISCRSVELVPVNYPGFQFDDDYISTAPGLYPDRLAPLPELSINALYSQWRSLWIKIAIPEDCKPGKYDINITLSCEGTFEGRKSAASTGKKFTLEVLPAQLPPQTLLYTNWFHADCLATYYNVEIFSKEHWLILEKFFRNAAAHGINLLLTPVFTPPLDTKVGGERPTVQLVKVFKNNGVYSFDFSLLAKWIDLAEKCGITHFEISHLFTQWGAEFTPKIIALTDGREERIFGWDVPANSPEYEKFLGAFLPELTAFLRAGSLEERVFFHTSDEPHNGHEKSYGFAANLLKKHLDGFRTLDALSDVKYYRKGLVPLPVPVETRIEDFVAAKVPELWTYYCCYPGKTYSNRFITMPSSRNRVMGLLLYRYGIKGFLHWGYNFYYSQFSIKPLNPYICTDADGAFPAGDSFVVYPGEDGEPEDSLRLEVFHEALQDQRALQLLEKFIPRRRIIKLLDRLSPGGKMSMANYPRGEKNILALRQKINALLKKHTAC